MKWNTSSKEFENFLKFERNLSENTISGYISDLNKLINYLVDKKMGDLMHAEQDATIDTFMLNDFKFREVLIDRIDEESIGLLMANSMVETIAACIYFDVNPFDQPAVEKVKFRVKKNLKHNARNKFITT